MEEKILDTIKEMLGIVIEDHSFDNELLSFINGSFMELWQIAVGPDSGYSINANSKWSDFTDEQLVMNEAKQFVFCQVKLIFDPPSNSFICDSLQKRKDEAYWRLYIMKDGVN